MALLRCESLALGYEGRKIAENISLTVDEGQFLCVVGDNGAGKSTLMKTMLGLLPPAAGRVAFGEGLRPQDIGYLPQQTRAQKDFPASVFEIVLSGCLNRLGGRPFYQKEHRRRAEAALCRLNIEDLRRRSFSRLSGGQQQRVLLARALCAADRLLMLDEPAAGLDPLAAEDLYRQLEALRDEGMAAVMISHDLRASLRLASHVLHLARAPLFFGAAEDYRQSPAGRLYALQEEAL